MNRSGRGKTIYLSNSRRRKKSFMQKIKLFMIAAVVVGGIAGIVMAFLPNAYQVTVGGKVVGAVKQKSMIETGKEVVVKQLEEQYKTTVKLEEEPVIKKVHAKKKELITPEYLTSYMRANMNFQIELRELVVDDKKVAIIENEAALEDLKKKLEEEYFSEDLAGKKVEFTNKVELKKVFAKESDIVPMDKLVERCATTTEEKVEYEVVPGDTLWGITEKLGVTMLALETSNPGINERLKIGSKVKATVDVPLLGLKVIEPPKTAKDAKQEAPKA